MAKELKNRVIVIDGSMTIHKAQNVFHTLSAGDINTGIAYGFLRSLIKLIKTYAPCEMCVVFDNSMNVTDSFDHDVVSYRQELFPGYKADRGHDDKLLEGVRLLFRFLKTLPVTIIYPTQKYEADDLVSFVVRKAFEDHMLNKMGKYEVIVVSDDKDFNQLICKSNGFSVKLLKKNQKGKGDRLWDDDMFRSKFGFSPKMFIPYLALLGDKGDCIPGVYGYGRVKSAALVRDNKWNEISSKLTDEECAIFLRNITLIELESGVEVVSKIFQPSLDKEKFNRLAKKYKMTSFLRKEDQEIIENINKLSFLEGTK